MCMFLFHRLREKLACRRWLAKKADAVTSLKPGPIRFKNQSLVFYRASSAHNNYYRDYADQLRHINSICEEDGVEIKEFAS